MLYLSEYNKSYKDRAELEKRFKIFSNRVQEYKRLNKQLKTSTVGVNMYSDWTDEELNKLWNPRGAVRQNPDPISLLEDVNV